MLALALIALALPAALADCSAQTYNSISGFFGSNGCVPSGYFQAQDLGNTTPDDLTSRCEAQCTQFSNCEAYVGQLWKAADSNLYTGQCYYYSSPPTSPRECVDHPTVLLAEKKDHSVACLSSDTAAATSFCSSVLSIPVVTVYTSTFVPVVTVRTTSPTTISVSKTTKTTTTTETTLVKSRTTRVTISSTTTLVSTATTTTTTTTTSTTAAPVTFKKRFIQTIPTPGCLSSVPSSRVTSACSCLSIEPSTTYLVSTAPVSTSTILKLSKTTATSFTTSTKVQTSKTTTTSFTTSTIVKSFAATTTATVTSTSVTVAYTSASPTATPVCAVNGRFVPGPNQVKAISTQVNRDDCHTQCINDPACKSWTLDERNSTCVVYNATLTEVSYTKDNSSSVFGYDKTCDYGPPPQVCNTIGYASLESAHRNSLTGNYGPDGCASQCTQAAACKSYTYNSATGQCTLYNEYVGFMKFGPSGGFIYYSDRSCNS